MSDAVRVVREERISERIPLYSHPEWRARWPWLLQATSGQGDPEPYNLSFFGQTPAITIMTRWREIREFTGFPAVVHARQVHGAHVLYHKHAHGGINIGDDADGHVTPSANALLAVSVADCVPVSIVDAQTRAIALLHAGWRGVAAGILERGIALLLERGSDPANLHAHFGPAICGKCYEVGPEVFAAVGAPVPATNSCIDLRGQLAARAAAAGVPATQLSVSAWCTRCDGAFYSHRAGHPERQMALLGVRP